MDLVGVRTFIAVVDTGQFQEAAAKLLITQQAVSKRIAALEGDLDARLLVRSSRGVRLTIDGQAFLPHARRLLDTADRALDSVRPERRALRVDVVNRQIGPATLVRDFHAAHAHVEIDLVTHFIDAERALAAVRAGEIDATFRAITDPAQQLQGGIEAFRVLDDPLELLISNHHPLAKKQIIELAELMEHRIWMPSIVRGTEWKSYYDALASNFDIQIDAVGPDFGIDVLLDMIAASSTLATFVGEHIRLVWPAEYHLCRIPVRRPMLVYPHSFIYRSDSAHPALSALRTYLDSVASHYRRPGAWVPEGYQY